LVVVAAGEKVLVTAIRVAGAVGVVLEKVDSAANTFLAQTLFGRQRQIFENPLAGTVMDDHVIEGVAFRRRIFRV
jgi:nitrate reductase beta subunit